MVLGAAAGSLLTGLSPLRGWALFVGALASAQADTWATEIGAHAPRRPRLITTGREVPRGTSGRVTALGSLGGLAGGISIMVLAYTVGVPTRSLVAGGIGGVAGLLSDSVLGATIQARFRCRACEQDTELRIHRCGDRSKLQAGWRWFDNDAVNFASTAVGAACAWALASGL